MRQNIYSEQQQAERLAELGSQLSRCRQEQDLTLEQVAARTMMQVRTLRAIEKGDLSQLPEPIYIRGFILRFAEALGLDGATLADAFPTEPIIKANSPSWKDLPGAQLRPIHLYVLYVAVIAVAVSALSYFVNRSTPNTAALSSPPPALPSGAPRSPTANVDPRAIASPNASPTANPIAAATPSPVPTTTGKPIEVSLMLKGQSWLRVEVDDKTVFEGILSEGSQRTWGGTKEITLRSGNAGAVLVSVNGGEPKPMGERSAVEELTVTPKTIAAAANPTTTPPATNGTVAPPVVRPN